MQYVASLIALLVLLLLVVSRAARSRLGKAKRVVFAARIVLIVLLALVVTFAAGSVSGRGEVGIGAAIIVCGAIIAWQRLGRSGRIKLLAAATAGATALVVYTIRINHPRPIPEDRVAFVGVWTSDSGFRLEIRPDGTGTIRQRRQAQDGEHLDVKVAPNFIDTANVDFEGHRMTFIRHGFYARVYTIDKAPFFDGSRHKMVLNGIELVRE
jgi:hypothetical protein